MPASIGTYVDAQGRTRSWADDRLGERMRLIDADLMRRGWTRDASGQWVAPTTRVTGLPPLHSPSSYAQIQQAIAGNVPVPTGTLQPSTSTTATPVAAPTVPQLSSPVPQVRPFAQGPLEMQQNTQISPLMQMFNFPRLRTKKPAQATGGGLPGAGQYNAGFWNAWRL